MIKIFTRKPSPPSGEAQPGRHFSPRTLLLALALVATLIISSCVTTTDRVLLAPPNIPGAKFVGSEACEQCHEDKVKSFKTATHARLQAKGENAKEMGCEGCHGPGSLHVEAGGGRNTAMKVNIINPRKSPETCFKCHLDKRGDFSLPYAHPVLAGKVNCGDCHDPHKGSAIPSGGTAIASQNETCFKCHSAQKGPFVFEHEALREGCTTCHRPHGSVNAKMLTERSANLCLKCHFQTQTAGGVLLVGGADHANAGVSARLRNGTCFSGDCHEAIHGSQVNSHLRR